jgi:hypothetical protein
VNADSARHNTFVTVGFGNDKLMVDAEEGCCCRPRIEDTDIDLSHVDKYTYSSIKVHSTPLKAVPESLIR